MDQDQKYGQVPETCGFNSQGRKSRFHDSCSHSRTRSPSSEWKRPNIKKRKIFSKVCAKDCLNDLSRDFAETYWEVSCTFPEHLEQKILRYKIL